MENNDLKFITAKHFDAYATNWEERLKHQCYLTRYNTVEAMLKSSITNTVALGCGTGDYSTLFSSSVSYIGIDNSSGMISKAKSLYPDRESLLEDVENTSVPDNYADCVLAIGLFEYLENPSNLVEEIWRITKKNGQIICAFPNRNNITKNKVSFLAKPIYLAKKVGRLFLKKDQESQNPLAPKGYAKDSRIVHRKFDEIMVLELFDSSRFIHTQTRFANFNIITYFSGLTLLKRLDERVSTIITAHNFDPFFSICGSILLMSFNKE